ncbi:TPA: hypothetical protein ACK3Q6_004431 [Burkholderia cepacia]
MSTMQTFHKRAAIDHSISAVFRVPTGDAGNVFMRVDRTNYENDKRAVVEVRADRFLELWRQDPFGPHAELANGNPSTWINDRKYAQAVDGFAHGETNPVPLAEINVGHHAEEVVTHGPRRWLGLRRGEPRVDTTSTHYVTFTNGITRTIYLLANKAEVFPVTCPLQDAELLHRLAGSRGSQYSTIDQLVPPAAPPLETFAEPVRASLNTDLFTDILRTFEAAAYERGYVFLSGGQGVQLPAQTIRELGEVVVLTRETHLAPRVSTSEIDRVLANRQADGTGDAMVRGILKALAARGVVPAERTKLDFPPSPVSLASLETLHERVKPASLRPASRRTR